jgi:hypothetical protein
MKFAFNLFVNLAMASRPVGEIKLKSSQEEIDALQRRREVARHRQEFRSQLLRSARKSLVAILFATIAITVFWHRFGLFNEAFTVVHHMSAQIKTVGATTQLQQQTAGYEQEVNQIAQADPPSK